jgi:hypothetical protein
LVTDSQVRLLSCPPASPVPWDETSENVGGIGTEAGHSVVREARD